jgi:basic membrane protein A
MYKKLSSVMALLLITTLFLAACQTATHTPKNYEGDCPKAEILCVGLVTGLDGIDDHSFNQTAWEGMLKAKTENVADWVRYIETIDSKDYHNNIVTFTDAGYDVIVTVGDLLGEATATAAKSYPGVLFVGVEQGQDEALPNLVGLVFHEDQSGFLAGALAAQMTKTNTIAAVLDENTYPSIVAFKEGYEAGAKYINSNIHIISTYNPGKSEVTITDPEWGANITAQTIQNGADVIFGGRSRTGIGALIETASHPGLYCIGVDTDQWDTNPEVRTCLISSAVKLITPAVFDLVKLAKDGNFPSGNYYGSYGMSPYHDFDSVIPKAVKDKMNQISAGLKDGSISTGYNPGR